MINYRKLVAEDFVRIKELCAKYSVEYNPPSMPTLGFIAETVETKELIGFTCAHSTVLLEPFIAEHASVAVKLYFMMDGALQAADTKTVVVHVKKNNNRLQSELRKLGFVPTDENYVVYRR